MLLEYLLENSQLSSIVDALYCSLFSAGCVVNAYRCVMQQLRADCSSMEFFPSSVMKLVCVDSGRLGYTCWACRLNCD